MKKFTHFTCYIALAAANAAVYFGFSDGAVLASTAIHFLLLAMDEINGSRQK